MGMFFLSFHLPPTAGNKCFMSKYKKNYLLSQQQQQQCQKVRLKKSHEVQNTIHIMDKLLFMSFFPPFFSLFLCVFFLRRRPSFAGIFFSFHSVFTWGAFSSIRLLTYVLMHNTSWCCLSLQFNALNRGRLCWMQIRFFFAQCWISCSLPLFLCTSCELYTRLISHERCFC